MVLAFPFNGFAQVQAAATTVNITGTIVGISDGSTATFKLSQNQIVERPDGSYDEVASTARTITLTDVSNLNLYLEPNVTGDGYTVEPSGTHWLVEIIDNDTGAFYQRRLQIPCCGTQSFGSVTVPEPLDPIIANYLNVTGGEMTGKLQLSATTPFQITSYASSAPASPNAGDFYLDSDDWGLYVYTGSAWQLAGSGSVSGATSPLVISSGNVSLTHDTNSGLYSDGGGGLAIDSTKITPTASNIQGTLTWAQVSKSGSSLGDLGDLDTGGAALSDTGDGVLNITGNVSTTGDMTLGGGNLHLAGSSISNDNGQVMTFPGTGNVSVTGEVTADAFHGSGQDLANVLHNNSEVDHLTIQNVGSNTHAQIDTAIANSVSHIADTANPHGTDIGNLGSGTLAELNTAVVDATLFGGDHRGVVSPLVLDTNDVSLSIYLAAGDPLVLVEGLDGNDYLWFDTSKVTITQSQITDLTFSLAGLSDVDSATQTSGFVLASTGGNYAGRALLSTDLPAQMTDSTDVTVTGWLSGAAGVDAGGALLTQEGGLAGYRNDATDGFVSFDSLASSAAAMSTLTDYDTAGNSIINSAGNVTIGDALTVTEDIVTTSGDLTVSAGEIGVNTAPSGTYSVEIAEGAIGSNTSSVFGSASGSGKNYNILNATNTHSGGYTQMQVYNNGGTNHFVAFGVGGDATAGLYDDRGYIRSSSLLSGFSFLNEGTGDTVLTNGGPNASDSTLTLASDHSVSVDRGDLMVSAGDLDITGNATLTGLVEAPGGVYDGSGGAITYEGSKWGYRDTTGEAFTAFDDIGGGGGFSGDVSTTTDGYLTDSSDDIVDVTDSLQATENVTADQWLHGEAGLTLGTSGTKSTVFHENRVEFNNSTAGDVRRFIFGSPPSSGTSHHYLGPEDNAVGLSGRNSRVYFGAFYDNRTSFATRFWLDYEYPHLMMGSKTVGVYWAGGGGGRWMFLDRDELVHREQTEDFTIDVQLSDLYLKSQKSGGVVRVNDGTFQVAELSEFEADVSVTGNVTMTGGAIYTDATYGEVMFGTDGSGNADVTIPVTATMTVGNWTPHIEYKSDPGSGARHWIDAEHGGASASFDFHIRGASTSTNVSISWSVDAGDQG